MAATTPRSRILIVDDEQGPRESLRMILASEYDVLTARDGASALSTLREREFDLVTVDLNMPGMRGDELMRTIRDEFPEIEIIIITGYGTVETAIEGLRYGICDYLNKPFDVVQVAAAVERALLRRRSRGNLLRFLEGIGEVLGLDRDASGLLGELEENATLRDKLRALLREPALDSGSLRRESADPRTTEFLEVLAESIECRDVFMRGHSRRVAFLAALLAERLGLDGECRESVRLAAFLHDLGKVGVPSDILSRTGDLDVEERASVEQHAAVGERLVEPLGFSSAIGSAIRHHHERWDGSGYPDGLRGDEIPLTSRIVCIVDAFDAMITERPNRCAMDSRSAVERLRKLSGSHFDPLLVKELSAIVESGACDMSAPACDQDARMGDERESAAPSTLHGGTDR